MKNLLSITLALCLSVGARAQTPRIEFGQAGLYPEGTTYDARHQRFFVSSATTGVIGTVDLQGNYQVFFTGDSLKSTFGMKVDPVRARLWVCAGDPNYSIYHSAATFRRQIRLIGLDLNTGKIIADVDLSTLFQGLHFANDLALDDKGNIYITDSYSPAIYKVDGTGKASLFATNDLFKGVGVGLNGIAYSNKGYLIVVNGATGSLLKIPVLNPSQVAAVKCPVFFNGGDGLLLDGEDLLVVQNKGINKVSRLSSVDDWRSAKVAASTSGEDRFANPSTITKAGAKYYALNAKLNELTDSTLPRSKNFSLQEVVLRPM